MKKNVVKEIIDLFEYDRAREAFEVARKYDICITEIWEDDEIIGMSVEDEVIYFLEREEMKK